MPNMLNSQPGRNYGPGENDEKSKTRSFDAGCIGNGNNRDGRGRRQADYRKPVARATCRGRAVLSGLPTVPADLPGAEVRACLAGITVNLLYRSAMLSSRIGTHPHSDKSSEGVSL